MSREVRPIAPVDGETFRFYCCGPTVYGPAHIGNFRTFVLQDVFRRVVEASGLTTKHVRNITDVDDKTIRQSQAEDKSLQEFTGFWTARFHHDCRALHLLDPHVEPGAVEHIPEQIDLIARLLDKKHAYVGGDGSVYFRIDSFPDYGRLSRLQERSITTNASAGEAELADEYDRDSAADFALWKSHRPTDGPNAWDSPWGRGRPGWHIECSAMSMKHLGESFDLHGGGVDLVFPHHENEIAQSEAATGKLFANHWFHVAHLLVDGQKMSKSLGNLYTLEDVQARGFRPEELRYVLLSGSYRQPLNFTWESLHAARKALARLREAKKALGGLDDRAVTEFGPFDQVFAALFDDLNTPEALGRLFPLVRQMQHSLDSGEFSPETREAWRKGFSAVMRAFGFLLEDPVLAGPPEEVVGLAQQRWEAKKAKNWAGADQLRAKLAALGWKVRDSADQYELEPLDS
jgi:cysteinyl-tRNA synthetase